MAKKQVDDSIEVASPARLEDIEQFIIEAGSDDLETFGGGVEGGIHCQQIPDEFAGFLFDRLISGQAINDYLEIGAAAGGTTFLINHFLKPQRIVLIDDGKHPKAALRADILTGINRTEIIGNSRDQEIVDQVEGEFDLIMVDGDHSYFGCLDDSRNYIPKLRDGGLIAFHDSVHDLLEVRRVVDILKKDDRVIFVNEYISKTQPHPCGIAIFRKVAAE
jgi:predicted O-methyltransferase YrrM